MRIGVCDDLPECRLEIKSMVSKYFELHHSACEIREFSAGDELLKSDDVYDILFLDIELGDLNGIDVAKEIQKKHKNTVILVVTAYHQYLDDAMDINVTRYIDKPVTENRIFSALDKAMRVINESIVTLHIKDGHVVRLKVSEVVYAEARLKGVFVYTESDVSYRVKETLKQLRYMFDTSCFGVPHNSFLVNMNYIKNFQRNEITLGRPFSGTKISVATRKQTEFKRRFLDFIGEDIDNEQNTY